MSKNVRCPFNDCGWCYSEDSKANSVQGACVNPSVCPVNKPKNIGISLINAL